MYRFASASEMALNDSLGQFPTHSAQEGTPGTCHHHQALRPGNGISPVGRRLRRLLAPQPALPPSGRPRRPREAASAYRRLPCGGTSASTSTAAALPAASCPCCVAASRPCWPRTPGCRPGCPYSYGCLWCCAFFFPGGEMS
ncbi:uncharacterized protein LOC126248150 isoform X2 [Schistocerca nitens]|uniref:uncharacterized protein LOC126248150 isoform X2 n=1 Tax=Schistocerca nitens TaxID=7011 RepID=UPI00211870CD|nr:uncharacterized protein LOC126248150 isoform X2 [Schistocerca nitens]